MSKIKYSYKTKYNALVDLKNGLPMWEISKKYNINSGPALIYYWKNRYNNIDELLISSFKEEENMSKIELKENIQEKRIKELENELKEKNKIIKNLKKNNEANEAKIEVLKKWNPSCQVIDMKGWNNNLAYKHFAFTQIYLKEFGQKYSIKYWCKVFDVSESKYYNFKNKFNLLSSKEIKNYLNPPFLPIFLNKINPKLNFYIEEFYKEFKVSSGSEKIRNWIRIKYNINISKETIRKHQLKNPHKFPVANRPRKYSLNNKLTNLRSDLIKDNYTTYYKYQKIGQDGTWFKNLFINGKRTKILAEIAYDWYSRTIISYSFSESEDKNSVLNTLNGVFKTLKKNDYSNSIIQMDRGTANRSYEVLQFEKSQNCFTISMSDSGFKHNSVTESLNGWFKENFYRTYGNHFNSLNDFFISFKLYTKNRNKLQRFNYTNKKEHELEN